MGSVVVADSGPLHYLILIDRADLLEKLFERVLVPTVVRDELLHARTPQKVKGWIATVRPWFVIESVTRPQPIPGLHKGESEALELAIQTKTARVRIDDLDGRAAARRLGLDVIGTLGILERLAELDIADLPNAVGRLSATNFFASPEILAAALARDSQRRRQKSQGPDQEK